MGLVCACVFSQADWGESLDWKKAFYAYAAGSNLTLNESQKMYLIYNYFYKDYQQFHEDEFEWEDHKNADVKAITEEIATFKDYKDKKYYVVTKAEFGSYDFERQGYPVEIANGVYFQFNRAHQYAKYEDFNSVPDMALYPVDFGKYNFFPMEKEKAKTFQAERKDRYGDIDRSIILVVHYQIEDFTSKAYKDIEKTFASSAYKPVAGNISAVEIYDKNNKKIGDLIQK